MRIALATYSKRPQLTEWDQKLIPLFQNESIHAEAVVWDAPHEEWSNFDAIIIRSIWDYHLKYKEFINWLSHLKTLEIPVLNPIEILKKNAHKFYLKELCNKGISVLPSLYLEQSHHIDLSQIKKLGWENAVIKPAVSASSFLTKSFNQNDIPNIEKEYKEVINERDLLVQQFAPEIPETGEYSIMFFNRTYAHTVLKKAKQGEFRVQSDFGGSARSVFMDKHIIDQAEEILSHFEGPILQARVDGIIRNDQFVLMEIELIEPQLFFNLDKNALSLYVQSATSILRKLRT